MKLKKQGEIMKKLSLSLVAMVAASNMLIAGGDIVPVPVPVVVEESNNFYLGLGVAAVSTRDFARSADFFDEENGQDRLGNLTFIAGYDFNEYSEYIAAEARYTFSIADEDQVEMSGWSIFLKPQYTFEDDNGEKGNFKIYGLLGFGGVTLDGVSSEYSNGNPWVDVDDTGFQWGLGASYSFKEYTDDADISIFIDYTMLADEMEGVYWNYAPETNVDALTVGLIYNF